MIKNNYHTHTYRCGHAVGEDEEYIEEAIAMGLTELGFTDHIMLPDHSQPGIRGDYSLLPDYINSLTNLREKYKDRIKIYIGLEAEAMEYYFPYYRELLTSGKIDYLICGNHCEINGGVLKFFFSSAASKKEVNKYVSTLINGMETGLFKFVAHPDYYMGSYLKWDHFAKKCAIKIIKCAVKNKIPLEFNFGGIRSGKKMFGKVYRYGYPDLSFWKLAKRYHADVILGLDAHSPKDLSNPFNDEGYKIIKKLNIIPIQKLDIK